MQAISAALIGRVSGAVLGAPCAPSVVGVVASLANMPDIENVPRPVDR